MQIANPIYDVVFKYLMEDNKVASLLLSTILDEKIISLEFQPQENVIELEQRSLTVYRMDFSAKIEIPGGGYKQVLIEIQKAKFATDIMRFRRYLGQQYQKKENQYRVKDTEQKKPLPILTIYFLGHKLEHTTAPVIKVNRQYFDVTTGEELKIREEFVGSLTHDSYIIQIPYLRRQHRTELEQLLDVFDQRHATSDIQILEINEKNYPEKCRPLIRRLQRAVSEPEIRQIIDAEDEILQNFQELERDIEKRDRIIRANQKYIEEKEKTLKEKEKTIEENRQTLKEKDRIIAELQKKLNNR